MTLRKILFWCHLAAGLVVGLVILSSSVTGLALAFEPQLVAWAERGVRRAASPAEGAARLGVDALAQAALAAHPGGKLQAATLRSDPGASAAVNLGRETGTVYVDPYSGEVLGKESKLHGWMHGIEDWHRWLWSRETGKKITGASAAAFFFMILSGLYLWWPRKTTRFNARLSGKARDWNWHNAVGFWFAPFFLITAVTGLVMSYEWATALLYRATGNEPPPRRAASAATGMEKGRAPTDGAARGGRAASDRTAGGEKPAAPLLAPFFARALARAEGWESISVRLPRSAGEPVTATIVQPSALGPEERSVLTLDAATAAEVKWEPYKGLNSGRRLRAWMKPLHTGEAWGLLGQLLAFLASGAATLLVWTGLALAWRRFFRKAPAPAGTPAPRASMLESGP